MPPRHRRHQGQAQSGSRSRPARVKPHEPLGRSLTVRLGDTGAAIGDRYRDVFGIGAEDNADTASGR